MDTGLETVHVSHALIGRSRLASPPVLQTRTDKDFRQRSSPVSSLKDLELHRNVTNRYTIIFAIFCKDKWRLCPFIVSCNVA